MRLLALIVIGIGAAAPAEPLPDVGEIRSGKPFVQALDQPIAATWENVDARTIARRLTVTRGTAIVLDRRIDPSRERTLTASGESLRAFCERFAGHVEAGLSIVGNTIYIGPPAAA